MSSGFRYLNSAGFFFAVFDIGCTSCIEVSPGLNAKVSVDIYFKLYDFLFHSIKYNDSIGD